MTKRKTYTKAFKIEAVSLLESGEQSAEQLARELGVRRNSLYKWQKELSLKGDHAFSGRPGPKPSADAELARLKRENERLRGRLANTPQVEGGPEKISVSIGLSMLRAGIDADALIEQADQALYRAKARGRNRVEVAGEERRSKPSTIMVKQGGEAAPTDEDKRHVDGT